MHRYVCTFNTVRSKEEKPCNITKNPSIQITGKKFRNVKLCMQLTVFQ